jgi:hypothetical protein
VTWFVKAARHGELRAGPFIPPLSSACVRNEVEERKAMAGRLPPVAPSEIQREKFMAPLGLSVNRLVEALGVPASRITAALNGMHADTTLITACP